jgi:hypothetical protein
MAFSIYKATTFLDALIEPAATHLQYPYVYRIVRFGLWSLYGFWAGIFLGGIWVIAHECGHHAFSDSKLLCDTVGFVVHSAQVLCLLFSTASTILTPQFPVVVASVLVCRTSPGASLMHSTMRLPVICLRIKRISPLPAPTSISHPSIHPRRISLDQG